MKKQETLTTNQIENTETKKKKKKLTKNEIRRQLEDKYFPFDALAFFDENAELVSKFLRKHTLRLVVNEEYEIPEEWQYKNNPAVLAANVKREFTLLEKLEWIKCSLDPIYYCKKYVKITSLDEGIIPFRMFPYQIDLIEIFENNSLTVACLGRQLGKTTVAAGYIVWYIHFHKAKQSAVLANKADQAQEIMERIQQSYELLPVFLKPGVRVYNKRSMTLENKSKAFSGASSISSVRGKSINLLYWDEAAWTPNDWAFYESILPTLSSGTSTKLIMTSTPNGKRGVFYKVWSDPNSGFAKKMATWRDNPSRTEEWKQKTIAASSYEQFLQEHECEFRGAQNSLLSGTCMMDLVHIDPIETRDDLKIYEFPQENHLYTICCDTSRGIGGDYHAFSVIDVTDSPYKVVATFRNNKMSPLIYPTLIHNVASYYNQAITLVELNDIGEQVANILYYDLEYENILMTITERNRQVVGFGANSKPGVRTSTAVKSIGCSTIKTMIEQGKLIVNDADIINEFGTFVPKGRSYEAAPGSHDDLVMTLVLFGWLSTQSYFIEMTNKDFRSSLLKDFSDAAYEEITPFGIIDNGVFTYEGDVVSPEHSGVFGGF